jgi:hypothetical protein
LTTSATLGEKFTVVAAGAVVVVEAAAGAATVVVSPAYADTSGRAATLIINQFVLFIVQIPKSFDLAIKPH